MTTYQFYKAFALAGLVSGAALSEEEINLEGVVEDASYLAAYMIEDDEKDEGED